MTMTNEFSARSNWFTKSNELDLCVYGYEMGDGVYHWFVDYKGNCVRRGWAFNQGDATDDAKQAVKDLIFLICNARQIKTKSDTQSKIDTILERMRQKWDSIIRRKNNDKR